LETSNLERFSLKMCLLSRLWQACFLFHHLVSVRLLPL